MAKSIVKEKPALSKATVKSLQGWAGKINGAWRKAVSAYIETGKLLIEAKASLKHGEWTELLENEEYLSFDERKAQKLMKIARHPIMAKPSQLTALPSSWTTLDVLCTLAEPQLTKLIKQGKVHSNMDREDAIHVVKELTGPEEEDEKPTKPTKGSKFSRDAEDAETDDGEGEVIDHDPDERPAPKSAKGKAAKPTQTKGSGGGMSPVQSAISNYGNGVDSLLEFIETLDEHLPDDDDPTLPAQIMTETKKLIANLNRIVKEYK